MRRLRLSNRMLSVVLVVCSFKALISGPRLGVVIVGAVAALLLLASLLLTRQGRRLDPRSRANASTGEP